MASLDDLVTVGNSVNKNISQLILAINNFSAIYDSILAVANGGTGNSSLTANAVLTGNGTNPIIAEGAFVCDDTGNVGIGTASPTNKLSVIGSANISTNLTVSGSGVVLGTLGVGTASPSNTLTVSGNANITGNLGVGVTTPTAVLNLKAGTATASTAPLKFTSGTNLTTAEAGAIEYDGTVFYCSAQASTRGNIPSQQFVVLNSAYTLTSQTAVQKLFNNTTNGAVTLPVGTHYFECFFSLSNMSASSGSFGFAFGGSATFTQAWWSVAQKGTATLATATATQSTYNTTANTTLATASVNTVGYAQIRGTLNVTVTGTVIPQVSLGVANAAVVGVGSYFKIFAVNSSSSTTNVTIGNWS